MLLILTVITGLMAGIYLAFSVFIMRALDELPAVEAALVMNKINDVIVTTAFLPMFFGSTLAHVVVLAWSIIDWQPSASGLRTFAAVVYIVGMFLVTAFGNVPRNNRLKQSAQSSAALPSYWQVYRRQWTKLNHVRTLACVGATLALIASLT